MFSVTFPAVMLSAVLVGQRPAVEMPGRTNAEILANCMSYLRSKSPEDRSFAISTMGLMGKDARGHSRQLCEAFLDSAPRSATVTAVEATTTYELTSDTMEVLRRQAPAVVAAIVTGAIRDVTRRLRKLDERIAVELEKTDVES